MVLGLEFFLPPLGVSEDVRYLRPITHGKERASVYCAIGDDLKCVTASVREHDKDFSAVTTAEAISPTTNSVSLRFDADTLAFRQCCASSSIFRPTRMIGNASRRRPCARSPMPA